MFLDKNPVGKIEGIPLFEGHLRRNHLPGSWSQQSSHISFSHSLINQTVAAARSSALILNTFHDLEAPFLTHLSSIFNKIYTIGPLHALFKSKLRNSSSPPPTLIGFWKDDESYISWLDSQPPGSVISISFGSSMKMEARELTEFWHGLVNSGKRFLCVLRSDGVYGGESAELIKQMVGERGYDRNGVVVEWADQEKVLSHPAIGGFLTHCGWNSTLESIVGGVPMIGWPVLGDQPSNATWIDKVWKIGIERNDEKNWERSTVEMMIRELMDSQKGVEIRRTVKKLSKLANDTVVKGGLSFDNLEHLVQHIKNLKPDN